MNVNYTKEELKNFIASGEEETAFNELIKIAKSQNEDLQDLIFLTSNKFRKLKHRQMIGNITSEQASVTLSEINHNLLEIINALQLDDFSEIENSTSKTIDTTYDSKTGDKPKTPQPTTKIGKSRSLYLIAGAIVLSILVFIFVNPLQWLSFSTSHSDQLEWWAGAWQQEVEATMNSVNVGTIRFETKDDEILGTADNEHPLNSSTSKTILHDMELSADGYTLSGKWKHQDSEDHSGTFEFQLSEDKKSFTGQYVMEGDSENTFFWNGTRPD